LLETGEVTEISFDRDWGDDQHDTGYSVIVWVIKAVMTRRFVPPAIYVHSNNASARVKTERAIAMNNKLRMKIQL